MGVTKSVSPMSLGGNGLETRFNPHPRCSLGLGKQERQFVQGTALKLFGGLAQSYDSAVDFATLFQDRRWKRWVMELLGDGEEGAVLDVGCGTLLLEQRCLRSRREFVGLDLSWEMIGLGLRKRLPNVVLAINGDAESLPFPDGSFATVVSCYVPKYVDTAKFANEISRVARADALVVLYDFARPRGILAPFLELYIQGGLRVMGALLSLAGSGSSVAFRELPRIVDSTVWEGEIGPAMEARGFETIRAKRLTGGAVFAYCGRRQSH